MQTAKEHTKEFFQVFPDLKVSGDVKELFRTVCIRQVLFKKSKIHFSFHLQATI